MVPQREDGGVGPRGQDGEVEPQEQYDGVEPQGQDGGDGSCVGEISRSLQYQRVVAGKVRESTGWSTFLAQSAQIIFS